MSAAPLVTTDGRVARSQRTRAAVIDALLDLLNEGVLKPTAAEIAERAGVSLRIVFHHFDDLEAIHSEAADRQIERLRPLMTPVSPQLPLADRIAQVARNRGRLYDTIAPVRRTSIRMEPFSAEIARRMKSAREASREWTRRAFEPELAAMAPARRRETLAALDAATAWETWEMLRAHQGLGEANARAVMMRMIRAILTLED